MRNLHNRVRWLPWITAGMLLIPVSGQALEQEYVAGVTPQSSDPGWVGTIRVGANLNFTHNMDVVGQENGSALTLGGNFDGTLSYSRHGHDWRNSLSLLETF